MMDVITYLIKFSLSLSIVYVFYTLLLKRLTFYSWNRLFLLCYSLACFFIPFINLNRWLATTEINTTIVLGNIPPFNKIVPVTNESTFPLLAVSIFSIGA